MRCARRIVICSPCGKRDIIRHGRIVILRRMCVRSRAVHTTRSFSGCIVCLANSGAIPYNVRGNPPPRLQSRAGVSHPMSEPVIREMHEYLFRLSPFREAYGAAICRRLPREVFGHRKRGSAWGGAPSRECVSTRLFPRSGTQWRYFLVPSFSQKSGMLREG